MNYEIRYCRTCLLYTSCIRDSSYAAPPSSLLQYMKFLRFYSSFVSVSEASVDEEAVVGIRAGFVCPGSAPGRP